MKPIGPLMREHRLIERMVKLLGQPLTQIAENDQLNTEFLIVAVDFFRTYADRTHHGKEEDILFRELAKKELSPDDKKLMQELIEEHRLARKLVISLSEASQANLLEKPDKSESIRNIIKELITLYQMHITKEDKKFFYPCLRYFSQEEQDSMLNEFWEFDRQMIHTKYLSIVEQVEKQDIQQQRLTNSHEQNAYVI